MKYKFIIGVCCALILFANAGCQLAQENAGENAQGDRLIGVFVTTEYLDLFDFDGYLEDNVGRFRGGEITPDGDTSKYQGRLYAVVTTSSTESEDTGHKIITEEYIFEDIEGMSFYAPIARSVGEHDSLVPNMADEGFSDRHTYLNYSDEKTSIALEATIYVAPSSEINTYYFNPVYQSADGSVYVVSGDAFMVNNESYSEGAVYSQTMEETRTITENGKAMTESVSITISISVMFAPEKIVILQMDADGAFITRTEYEPDALPEVLALDRKTAFFIAETCKSGDKGKSMISREIYDRDAENIETFFVRADGICVKHETPVSIVKAGFL